jgi:hypothetical protein
LEACIIPQGAERRLLNIDDYLPLQEVVEPFRILRNVGTFTFADAEERDMPNKDPYNRAGANDECALPASVEPAVKALVEGNSLVEHVFKMNRALAEYCQAFERYPKVVEDMSIAFGEAEAQRAERQMRENTKRKEWKNIRPGNPYKEHYCHLIEDALELASIASDHNNAAQFKIHCKELLEIVEPQYRRVINASRAAAEFVKDHKTPGGIFDPSPEPGSSPKFGGAYIENGWEHLAMEYVLLEDYADSFRRRDLPFRIKC